MISGLDSFLPPVIPSRWAQHTISPEVMRLQPPNVETMCWRNVRDGVNVMLSLEDRGSHGIWLHMSVTAIGSGKPPRWSLLTMCKDLFIGDEVAVQILPKKRDYLNVHPGCLHVFRRVDGETILPIWDEGP